jgi:hypothetical protein
MVSPAPKRIVFVGQAVTDYAAVRRLSDNVEWELTLAQYAALALPGAGAPPNVSGGVYTDPQWLAAWQANELMAYRGWAWDTPTKRLEFADVGIVNDKAHVGLGNGRVFTMWASNKAEAQITGVTWTGNSVNNLTVTSSFRPLPFTLINGILSLV